MTCEASDVEALINALENSCINFGEMPDDIAPSEYARIEKLTWDARAALHAHIAALRQQVAEQAKVIEGVRWRPASEPPPKSESPKWSVEILMRTITGAPLIGAYCFMDKSWRDDDDLERDIRCWMPLPDLPKDPP